MITPTYPNAKSLVNNARFMQLFPVAALAVLSNLKNIDVVAGIELSGIAPGALVAYALKKPFAYVRKKPKPYGRRLAIQGDLKCKRVLLVDDLLFYGQTKDEAVQKIQDAGGTVTDLFVIFTMEPGARNWSKTTGIPVHRLFDRKDIYAHAIGKGIISKALYDFEEKIYSLKDYKNWHTNQALWKEFVDLMTTDATFIKK